MDTVLHVRLTREQRRLIEQAANDVALEASTWIRMIVVEAAKNHDKNRTPG
jgi:uncharacterized protein (DUF1778 family)